MSRRDIVVAAPPCGDPDAYTALLDEALAAGATVVAVPLAQLGEAVRSYQAAAAITPAGRTTVGLSASRVGTPGQRARPAPDPVAGGAA